MNESKATRHQRGRRRAHAAGVVCAGVLLGLCAFTGIGAGLAAWSRAFQTSGPAVVQSTVAILILTTTLLLIWEAGALPMVWLMASSDRRTGRTAAGRDLYVAQLDALVLAWPASVALSILVLGSGWAAGAWWWLAAAALLGGLLVGSLHLAPGLLARAAGAEPIDRPALVERLGALARQVKVPIARIDALPASATVTTSALVAGAGADRRVFIADGLMRDWTDEEIAVVVAHELAHHAHHDLWSTLALDTVVLATGFWIADRVRLWIASGTPGPSPQLETLPLVALAACGIWLAAAPIRHALSRWQERRADTFALALTGSADAFQAAIRRLAAQHLSEERPSRLTRWFYHRHPSAAERLEVADAFKDSNN